MTNGLGGYASGTISGACTRRYHGLLIAALPVPLGRLMMLNHLSVEIILPDGHIGQLDREELPDESEADEAWLGEFQLEAGLPVWRYQVGSLSARKTSPDAPPAEHGLRLVSPVGGTRSGCGCGCGRRFIFAGTTMRSTSAMPRSVRRDARSTTASRSTRDIAPPLRMRIVAPEAGLLLDGGHFRAGAYRLEKARGYAFVGSLWSPGLFPRRLESRRARRA